MLHLLQTLQHHTYQTQQIHWCTGRVVRGITLKAEQRILHGRGFFNVLCYSEFVYIYWLMQQKKNRALKFGDKKIFYKFAGAMRSLLKYIIPILFVVALSNVASEGDSSFSSANLRSLPAYEAIYLDSFTSSSDNCTFAEPQILSSVSTRSQVNDERPDNAHRHTSKFVKSGKACNISIIHLIQKSVVLVSTAIPEHAHKLVFLGRLII